MSTSTIRQIAGWVRSAHTKIARAEMEWGSGDVGNLRYTRRRMRCARTLLQKAGYELGSIEHPGPQTRRLHAHVGESVLVVEGVLLAMDEEIARLSTPRATA